MKITKTTMSQHNTSLNRHKGSHFYFRALVSAFLCLTLFFAISCSDSKGRKNSELNAFSNDNGANNSHLVQKSQWLSLLGVESLGQIRRILAVTDNPKEYLKHYTKCTHLKYFGPVSDNKQHFEINWINNLCKLGKNNDRFSASGRENFKLETLANQSTEYTHTSKNLRLLQGEKIFYLDIFSRLLIDIQGQLVFEQELLIQPDKDDRNTVIQVILSGNGSYNQQSELLKIDNVGINLESSQFSTSASGKRFNEEVYKVVVVNEKWGLEKNPDDHQTSSQITDCGQVEGGFSFKASYNDNSLSHEDVFYSNTFQTIMRSKGSELSRNRCSESREYFFTVYLQSAKRILSNSSPLILSN